MTVLIAAAYATLTKGHRTKQSGTKESYVCNVMCLPLRIGTTHPLVSPMNTSENCPSDSAYQNNTIQSGGLALIYFIVSPASFRLQFYS